jgi:MFS family permease
MFLLYVPLLALVAIASFGLLGGGPRPRRTERALGPGAGFSAAAIRGVLRQRRLGLFFIGSVLLWMSNAAITTFLSIHVVALGADTQIVGLVWAAGAVIEVPLMFAFPAVSRRFGVERLVAIGAMAMALRALGFALAGAPAVVLAVAPLGGIGFALFYVGTVTVVARSVPREVQATAQGIFTGTTFSLGSILGSVLGGLVAGFVSLPVLFGLAAASATVATLVVWWAIGRSPEDPRSAEGSPARSAPHIASA